MIERGSSKNAKQKYSQQNSQKSKISYKELNSSDQKTPHAKTKAIQKRKGSSSWSAKQKAQRVRQTLGFQEISDSASASLIEEHKSDDIEDLEMIDKVLQEINEKEVSKGKAQKTESTTAD